MPKSGANISGDSAGEVDLTICEHILFLNQIIFRLCVRKSIIMVVVDRLTKYAQFCTLSHPFKESTVATAFMETIQKLHGNCWVMKVIV